MVRIKDIAGRLGLSLMTVSRALRNSADVAPGTRARVQQVAREMGYVLDVTARGLRTGSTHLIGAVIPSLADPFFARVAAGLEEAFAEQGYEVILVQSLNQPAREEAALRKLVARRVDGIVIWPAPRLAVAPGDPYAELRLPAGKTLLAGPPPFAAGSYPVISAHETRGVREAVAHLCGLGHSRIACLRGPVASPLARERFEGFVQGLREAGLAVDDALVFNAGWTFEEGQAALVQMLHEGRNPSAVVAVNDLVALGAVAALTRQGVRVPRDVSVVGHGNLPVAVHSPIPLTTVRVPKYALGVHAATQMIRLLRGESAGSHRLPVELVVRDSTGPVRESSPG
jgi:DNA-binding LacI/PurR family transcriptional regulator